MISLTAQNYIKLEGNRITQTDEGIPGEVENYFVYRSTGYNEALTSFNPIAYAASANEVDSLALPTPRYYYRVQACGPISE